MERVRNKLDYMMIAMKNAGRRFWEEERGDTNFISIAIILIVVIAVAVVFISLKDTILTELNTKIENLTTTLSPEE